MKVYLVYFDGISEPKALLDYFAAADSFLVSTGTWLVAWPNQAGLLFGGLKKCISDSQGLVVVPLDPELKPLHCQNAGTMADWLSRKFDELK